MMHRVKDNGTTPAKAEPMPHAAVQQFKGICPICWRGWDSHNAKTGACVPEQYWKRPAHGS